MKDSLKTMRLWICSPIDVLSLEEAKLKKEIE